MTLIEVIVAIAIISIAGVMCVTAFMTVIGAEMRETNTRIASEQVEAQIASGADATSTVAAVLELGGYKITGVVESYSDTSGAGDKIYTEGNEGTPGQINTSGSRTYTLFNANPPINPPLPLFFGDGADAFKSVGDAYETGPGGGVMEYEITMPGKYRIEVWGARGGGVSKTDKDATLYAGGGKGGYSKGEVYLKGNEVLYLWAGGKGAEFNPDGLTYYDGGSNGGGGICASKSNQKNGGTTGGGASDVRLEDKDDLYSRLIVAGGGGGGGLTNASGLGDVIGVVSGGVGGGISGADATVSPDEVDKASSDLKHGCGGTQAAGGGLLGGVNVFHNPNITIVDPAHDTVKAGSFGFGGQGIGSNNGGAGGGGGWYGGGGGFVNAAGGGSGWVYTESAYNGWASSSGNPTDAAKYNIDSSYYFSNTSLVRGDGKLNDASGAKVDMPDPLDTKYDPYNPDASGIKRMNGNDRGGFVRIIYIESSI